MFFKILLTVALGASIFQETRSQKVPCFCSHLIEITVYTLPNVTSKPVGYMYEFDCKPKTEDQDAEGFYKITMEHQIGYVEKQNQIQEGTCMPEDVDLLTTTPDGQTPTKTTPSLVTTTESTILTTTTTRPTTTPFTRWDAAANVTGFSYENVGVGYNLLEGAPEQNPDPGLLLEKRVLQISGVRNKVEEMSLYGNSSCSFETLARLIHGSKSLQEEMFRFVHLSADHSYNITEASFTYNSEFWEKRKYLDSGSRLYIDHIVTCRLETVQYRSENDLQHPYVVTREFATDVCRLDLDLDNTTSADYFEFIDNWGTSIVISADMGWRNISRYETNRPKLFQDILKMEANLLELSEDLEGYTSSLEIKIDEFYSSRVATHPTASLVLSEKTGTKAKSVVTRLDLVPIYKFIDWTHFEPVLQLLKAENVCSDALTDVAISQIHNNIKQALDEYNDYKNEKLGLTSEPQYVKDHDVRMPITWPKGTYGLIKASSGCPDNNVNWVPGWIDQDTDDDNWNNAFSSNIIQYLAGSFGNDTIKTDFCIKNTVTFSEYDRNWPKGSFCILKKGDCPAGFASGYIFWDDETVRNGNQRIRLEEGLPDGVFDIDTKVFYCCRNDSLPGNPIILPVGPSFVLLRYGTTCQAVHGMTVKEVFVDWTTDNTNNMDAVGGRHPYDDGVRNHHRLHFCHYSKSENIAFGK